MESNVLGMSDNHYYAQRTRRKLADDFLAQAFILMEQPTYTLSVTELLLASMAFSVQAMERRQRD